MTNLRYYGVLTTPASLGPDGIQAVANIITSEVRIGLNDPRGMSIGIGQTLSIPVINRGTDPYTKILFGFEIRGDAAPAEQDVTVPAGAEAAVSAALSGQGYTVRTEAGRVWIAFDPATQTYVDVAMAVLGVQQILLAASGITVTPEARHGTLEVLSLPESDRNRALLGAALLEKMPLILVSRASKDANLASQLLSLGFADLAQAQAFAGGITVQCVGYGPPKRGAGAIGQAQRYRTDQASVWIGEVV